MSSINKLGLAAAAIILITSFSAKAADSKSGTPSRTQAMKAEVNHFYSDAELDGLIQKNSKERHPAEVDLGANAAQDNYSDKMKRLEAGLLAARTGEDINHLLNTLSNEYSAFEISDDYTNPKYRDFRYFGARILPFHQMAGYAWRMVKVVEDGKIRASQEMLLGMIRSMAEEIKIHAPDSHNEAIFRFLTEPQEGYLTQFGTEKDVQDFYINNIAPEIVTAIGRIKPTGSQPLNLSQPIVYDARLRFGANAFPDSNEKRFRRVGTAEQSSAIARMYRRLAAINIFTAYDFSGYLQIRRDMGAKQGWDIVNTMGHPEIGGLTREARMKMMKKYPQYGARRPHCVEQMKSAFTYLHNDVFWMSAADSVLGKERVSDDSDWLLDPEVIYSRKDVNEHSLRNLRALTADSNVPVKLTSSVSGIDQKGVKSAPDTFVNVSLRSYFYNPPENLQELMPTVFEKGADKKSDKPYCPSCSYRNYFQGRAIGWKTSAYKSLFPDLKSDSDTSTEVARYMDILSEARGGRMTANFIAPFVR